MALKKKLEIATQVGLKHMSTLTRAVERGVLILSGDYIDDTHVMNKIWIADQQQKNAARILAGEMPATSAKAPPKEKPTVRKSRTVQKEVPVPLVPAPAVAPVGPDKVKSKKISRIAAPSILSEEAHKYLAAETQLATEIKRLDKEKKEVELEQAKIKLAKARGEAIPTDLAKVVIISHFKQMTVAFHQAADNLAVEFVSILGGGRKEQAQIRDRLIVIINKSLEDGRASSALEIDNIVKEYQEIRERGESK